VPPGDVLRHSNVGDYHSHRNHQTAKVPRSGDFCQLILNFAALASHYLLEACFCRPGERHDKGGVESRGKAVQQQVLVPIPVGRTLAVMTADAA
jgi:hypothetical protein